MMAHPLGLFRLASYLIFFPAEVVHLTGGAVLEPAPTLAILVAWLPLPLAAAWIRLSRMYAPIRWDVD